ncbi:hypothetical protein V1478_013080 [Vespula squamosa]|uniref:Uncharacterized protein n=1 Tax=Vespula squamosa TaxID=30214 RepID=A0ABD2ACE1_VESSQ
MNVHTPAAQPPKTTSDKYHPSTTFNPLTPTMTFLPLPTTTHDSILCPFLFLTYYYHKDEYGLTILLTTDRSIVRAIFTLERRGRTTRMNGDDDDDDDDDDDTKDVLPTSNNELR